MTARRPGRGRTAAAAAGLAVAGVVAATTAAAQLFPGNASGLPFRVDADGGLEWHDAERAYVARGNARAERGDTVVFADVLTARTRPTADGGSEIYRVIAEGAVRIVAPSQQVFGDHAVYDLDRALGVVTGRTVRLETKAETVTATDSLEFYETTKLAVARGDAVAVRGDRKMRADTLVGRFREDADGNLVLDRLDGVGGVVVTTPRDVVRSERLMYAADTDRAIMTGNVRITRGGDQITGNAAEMSLAGGTSRVLSAGDRVRALFTPRDGGPADAGR